jgi:pyruvate/oxaloacetate carboxyltransferase
LRGGYGRTPCPLNPELQKKALRNELPINCRPADLIPNAMDHLQIELKGMAQSDEDVLTYALSPHIALDIFKNRTTKT